MASFIYLYSKFTEEFLLLSAAGIFTLLSLYCYTWVVKKRRLGAARNQIPAGMVKIYLNQLINEAQFVRTQLFGLAGGTAPNPQNFAAHFSNLQGAPTDTTHAAPNLSVAPGTEISGDLMERLKALEKQLADKESMVVNINVEKTKLLEEVENLKQNEKVMGSGAGGATGNNDDLLQKMKALEERLEEYALFEDDLANLKRLQQENTQLKKQIEKGAAAAAPAPGVAPERGNAPADKATGKEPLLDQSAIDALLDGVSAIPPTETETPEEEKEPVAAAAQTGGSKSPAAPAASGKQSYTPDEVAPTPPTPISAKAQAQATAAAEAAAKPEENIAKAPATPDAFENLVDSVETSLSAKSEKATIAPTAQKEAAVEAAMAAPAQAISSNAEKTDEELLKEFENLLNS